VVLIVVLVRKRPLQKRISGAFGIARPQQQKPDAALGTAGAHGQPPHNMPPYGGGAGSGSGDAGWMGADVPDEAVMMRTPDITQEQMPGAVKVRFFFVTLL
jgi:hypothetical protein